MTVWRLPFKFESMAKLGVVGELPQWEWDGEWHELA